MVDPAPDPLTEAAMREAEHLAQRAATCDPGDVNLIVTTALTSIALSLSVLARNSLSKVTE